MNIELPTLTRTPNSWGNFVLTKPIELLGDHAYLEKKAASNALELLNRWPEGKTSSRWVIALAGIAKDEATHLAQVCRLLRRYRGELPRNHANPYAAELRRLVRKGHGARELVDRLLVAALIEARSCERFEVLSRVSDDPNLAKLYTALFASECGHYKSFLELSGQVLAEMEVAERWQEMLEAEANIMRRQLPGFRMHSGLP